MGEEVRGLVGMDAGDLGPVAGDVVGGDEVPEVVVCGDLEAGDLWGEGVDVGLAVAAVLYTSSVSDLLRKGYDSHGFHIKYEMRVGIPQNHR